ncbi:glycosyltransferase family 2 protein [Marinobacter confluentis]|uniref:Glycosyltransferase family 2 protein n=1 Tax=Marinobacter confluentis TaxID=1697557 RepID=A0A4Z1C8S0_9GAMM|nr:glycosyltransferase family A protein [Marinobacter confluentis]TGN39963.1 glycosyltransferase family 2 protein [Marinobacter confluentis]
MIDILLPTYNRSSFLIKNLRHLNNLIQDEGLEKYIKVIVSDNASCDDTVERMREFEKSIDYQLEFYVQEENIGGEKNCIYLLSKSKADYVMYLGDDDFIPAGYLSFVLNVIKTEKALCVIPGFSNILMDGKIVPKRAATFAVKKYEPGFKTVCELSRFGHQLSGLVVARSSLYDKYIKNPKHHNIYPFIFFLTDCMLRGFTFYAPKYQVLVSQGNIKDWSYNSSGLISDVFKNYEIAFPNDKPKRLAASLAFAQAQPWRLGIGKNPINTAKAFIGIVSSSEIDFELKFRLIFLYPRIYSSVIRKVFNQSRDRYSL